MCVATGVQRRCITGLMRDDALHVGDLADAAVLGERFADDEQAVVDRAD